MNGTGEDNQQTRPTDGFGQLGENSRLDARMRRDDKPYTPEQARELTRELADWRRAHTRNGSPLPWREIAERVGMPESTLYEVRNHTYRGDAQRYLRLIDQFLADARLQAGRIDDRNFATISVTRKIVGVVRVGIKNNSMPVIIGEPGSSKSEHARFIAADREGAALIRIGQSHRDALGVTLLLVQAFGLHKERTHRQRFDAIMQYLKKHRNVVIVVDEAQNLVASGLEMLRDIHDSSDPEGKACVPIVFFGDENFYKLIVKARAGEVSVIRPQMTRRMYPIYNVTADGSEGGDRAETFTAEDIVKILRNDRLRVVDDDGVRWLASLANVHGYGSLGFAMAVARMAFEIASKAVVTVADLQAAIKMAIGPRAVVEIDSAAGGELLRRVG